ASNIPVNGGDLISTPTGELLLVKRDDAGPSKGYDITSGIAVYNHDVSTAINGAALLQGGGGIMAEGANSPHFAAYDDAGTAGAVLAAVHYLARPFPLPEADTASRCMGAVEPNPPAIAPAQTRIECLLNSHPTPTIREPRVVFETAATGCTT